MQNKNTGNIRKHHPEVVYEPKQHAAKAVPNAHTKGPNLHASKTPVRETGQADTVARSDKLTSRIANLTAKSSLLSATLQIHNNIARIQVKCTKRMK